MTEITEVEELKMEIEEAESYLKSLKLQKSSDEPINIDEQQRYVNDLKEELSIIRSGTKSDIFSKEEIHYRSKSLSTSSGLAVVIGHCSFKEGACGVPPINKCEFAFNSIVAEKIYNLCNKKQIRCKIFTREWGNKCLISSTYTKRVAPWNPRYTVELHYNGGTPTSPYTVTLYAREDSENWSLELQNQICKVYGRKPEYEQSKRILKLMPGQNGYSSTKHLPNSALIEPFFGAVDSDADMGQNRIDELASAVVQAFSNYP